jgi:hypothetical protein
VSDPICFAENGDAKLVHLIRLDLVVTPRRIDQFQDIMMAEDWWLL